MHTPQLQRLLVLCFSVMLLSACGNSEQTETAASADDADSDPFGICRMLTGDQVSSVLPGHDGGIVAHSGGSLIEGIDAYQCSYSATDGADFQLLTVIVNIASTDALYKDIKPTDWAHQGDQAIEVGDGGWVYGHSDDEVKVKVKKGRAVLDLELMTANAKDRSSQMVELAKVVAAKL